MALKSKEINIFRMLAEGPYTIRELARETDLSERNLRYSLENLEYYIKKILNKEIDKNNRRLSVSLKEGEAEAFLCSMRSEYRYSNDERQEYLLNYFLFSDNPRIREAEEVLGVSRTTLKKDIAVLEGELRDYSLEFQMTGNRLSIGGNEKKLRNLMMLKMERYLKGKETSYPLGEILKSLLEEGYKPLRNNCQRLFGEIEERMEYDYSSEFRGLMEYYLAATFIRIGRGEYILKKHNEDFLRKTHEYEVIRGVLKKEIPEEMEYELLHLAEYLISGSPQGKYYEERIGIELFTYELLQKLRDDLGVDLIWEEIFYRIAGYLKSAIYRMKNNFVLNTHEELEITGETGKKIEEICCEDELLSEKLRIEEIRVLEDIVERGIEERRRKVISMEELIEVVLKNSNGLNTEEFTGEIMKRFGEYVEGKRGTPLEGLSHYIGPEDIIEIEKGEEALDLIGKRYLEDYVEGIVERKDLIRSRIIDSEGIECYYFSETARVKRSGIKIVLGDKGMIVILILKDDQRHLKALSQLREMVEEIGPLKEGFQRGRQDVLKHVKEYV